MPWVNQPANGILVHRACHAEIETHPIQATGRGFRLGFGQHPEDTWIEDHAGTRWFLDNHGNKTTHHQEETA